MKYIIRLLLLIIAISQIYDSCFSQKYSSFEGRHFYIGFMQNELDVATYIELQVFIVTSAAAQIQVDMPNIPTAYYTIQKDSILVIDVPEALQVTESEDPIQQLVEINSDIPITVYSFNSQETTSDCYTAIPVSRWGKEHIVTSLPNDTYSIPYEVSHDDTLWLSYPRSSEFMVMAGYDSTKITFAPTAMTFKAKQVGRTYNVILNKGECYLVKSYPSSKYSGDLTGTIVRSTKPVGVITGHVRSANPQDMISPWDSKNHLCEMLPPTDAWGRIFVSVPFNLGSGGDLFRIIANNSGTLVDMEDDIGNTNSFIMSYQGQCISIPHVKQPTIWRSNQPIQIAQYMAHSGSDLDDRFYDPCLVILPPVEEFVTKILFQTPGNSIQNPSQFNGHYIALVAQQKALATLTLDGKYVNMMSAISSNNIPNTDLFWAKIKLSRGKHELLCQDGGFSGVLYGGGIADSYALVLGSSLNNPYKNDSIPPIVIDTVDECGRIRGVIKEEINGASTGIDFVQVIKDSTKNYKWTISTISDTANYVWFTAEPINRFQDGKITFDYRDKNSNGGRKTYLYYAIKATFPKNLNFTNVNDDDSTCINFSITNNGNDTLLIDSYSILGDTRLVLYSNPLPPFIIPPGIKHNCIVCFDPKGDSTKLNATLVFKTACDTNFSIPLTGTVSARNLNVVGYDFGIINLCKDTCAFLTMANSGNVPMKIDSLIYPVQSEAFRIDTTGIFPHSIKPNETMKIPVCFNPDSVGYFQKTIKIAYEKDKRKTVVIKGSVIAPKLNSISIDWGRKRVGTSNDTTVYIHNSGNERGHIVFEKFEAEPATPDNNKTLLSSIDALVEPGTDWALKLNYTPQDTSDYYYKAVFLADYCKNDTITIELKGKGTIPVIGTIDVRFDTTVVFQRRDSLANLIYSYGNENLTIDTSYYLTGDINQFEIDLTKLKSLVIPFHAPDSVIANLVSYLPKEVGKHKLTIGVQHDANPNYQRSVSEINFYGISKLADTSKAKLEIRPPEHIYTCINARYDAILKNTGNIWIQLDSLKLEATGVEANWIDKINLPIGFPVDTSIAFGINVFAKHRDKGEINVRAVFNDTIIDTQTIEIVPEESSLVLFSVNNIESVPGDTIMLYLHGEFPTKVDTTISFSIELLMDEANFYLLSNREDAVLSYGSTTFSVPVQISQEKERVTIKTINNNLLFSEKARWSLKIPFLTLLNNERFPEIAVKMSSEECFNPDSIKIIAKITEVCIFNLRSIKLITNLPFLEIHPNPVNDKLNVEIYIPEDESVDLDLYDEMGKNISLSKNLNLEKGNHSLIFNIGTLHDGVFMFSFKTKNFIKKSIFIILK